jgi:hypothetical protein
VPFELDPKKPRAVARNQGVTMSSGPVALHAKRREGSVATQDEIINRRAVAVAIVFGLASLILVILTFAK